MTVPVFEEFEPAADCDCAGCAQQRRALAAGGHPTAHGCRRALVLFTAAGMVLGGGGTGVAAAAGLPAGHARPHAIADTPAPVPTTAESPAARTTASEATVPARTTADNVAPASTAASGAAVAPAPGAASGAAVAPTPGAADPEPATEQGGAEPLHGGPLAGSAGTQGTAPTQLRKMTRAQIINRAKRWVTAKVPYSMEKYWSDGYRQDCSGYVSMAWNLAGNEWTGSLASFATRITREELQPGDILLFHNPDNPTKGSHVTIFGGWTDYTHDYYIAYEQTKPHTRKQATPTGYWTNADRYLPYRYKGLTTSDTESTTATATGSATEAASGTAAAAAASALASAGAYPGLTAFGPGASNAYIAQLAEMLAAHVSEHFRPTGPVQQWGESHRLATRAFQLAQGWSGKEADGLPGPETWRRLAAQQGGNMPAAAASSATRAAAPGATGAAAPKYPGREFFRPGQSNEYVTQLGRQLVKRGFGKYYTSTPVPGWSEEDRRNVEAFQRAQGWRGGAADGFPGPETWRRLFA
ncbi:peptidoglycan-binding protein [Streptomyces maoxianensis]|uniref:Peptidoglycan-binding protein n=1 Tax=Streptomyces maoxianensis TaxID=1459942 RepID=A0ABV9G5H8_9ACTN